MKIVIQRVQSASVVIEDCTVGAIKQGLLLLVGVGPEDTKEDLEYAVRKIVNMRIFSDGDGKMNLSVKDVGGQILSISQFTLFADTKKGNRPAFTGAAKPDMASHVGLCSPRKCWSIPFFRICKKRKLRNRQNLATNILNRKIHLAISI